MASTVSNGIDRHASPLADGSVVPFWLDGNEVYSNSTFDVISPITQKIIYQASSATENDVHKAVLSAQKAFTSWSRTKPRARQDIFLKAAERFKDRTEELRSYSRNETGADPAMFAFEHNAAYEMCRSIAGLIQPALESSSPVVDAEGSSAIVMKEPYGVVLAIAPWNAPNVLGLRSLLQPLAMGNTVILKGPEASPACYWALASIFHSAGLPAGCLNTLYHRPADAALITKELIKHPAIKKVNFTGSTPIGSIIASLAGEYLKPAVMELGGKAPAIICEDADVEKAAVQCALGAFLNAGQICMSTERIIVHRKVVKDFRQALGATIDHLYEQSKLQTPQLISNVSVQKNTRLLTDALSEGATLLYGKVENEPSSKTTMSPIVIEGVTSVMEIYRVESFGPSVSLYVVDSDEEAIKLANDTDYGLSSAIFTSDLRRGLKLAKEIEAGAVHLNGMSVHDEAALPHGGVNKSGFGRFNGLTGLNEWVRTKAITWQD